MTQSLTKLTKKSISQSFKKFLNKKPLNKVTVKDIVDDCQLTRQAFYYHFQDIYDLLEWTYKEEIGNLLIVPQNMSLTETIETIMSYINENKFMFKNTMKSIDRNHFEKIIYPDLYKFNKKMIVNSSYPMIIPHEKLDFLANIQTLTILSIVVKWTNNGMNENTHQCVEMLDITMRTATLACLKNI